MRFCALLLKAPVVPVELLTMDSEDSCVAQPSVPVAAQFKNPFHIEDLEVFDDETLRVILSNCGFGLTVEKLVQSLHGAPEVLIQRIRRNLPLSLRSCFMTELRRSIPEEQVVAARRCVLDGLFWELTYWKTPELYNELTEGEQLHPGIFQQLEPDVRDKIVLDAGAGCGRASFECVRYGARKVYAVEPSPGLLGILQQKLASQPAFRRIEPLRGRFDKLPLADDSVDTSLSCSAFTADPVQGGEPGLAEFRRVTRTGGKIVIIWPRVQDYDWLAEHGFQHVTLPMHEEMRMRFCSLQSALRCARHFFARNEKVVQYLLRERKPEIPFSVLGFNPPCDYCWRLAK
jgi:ubiquinone/menaquinone biosynthesis C-methylase UbiE